MGTDPSGTLQPGRGQTHQPGAEDTHFSQEPITTSLFVLRGNTVRHLWTGPKGV